MINSCSLPQKNTFFRHFILTVNVDIYAIRRYALTKFILQLTRVVSRIVTRHIANFQCNAIYITTFHTFRIYCNHIAIAFPIEFSEKMVFQWSSKQTLCYHSTMHAHHVTRFNEDGFESYRHSRFTSPPSFTTRFGIDRAVTLTTGGSVLKVKMKLDPHDTQISTDLLTHDLQQQ